MHDKKIKEEYEKWGLTMNINKYLRIGREESNLKLDEEEIEICNNYYINIWE